MAKRITSAQLRPLSQALRKSRKAHELTQAEMADALDISRKTYVLFESSRWHPRYGARARMIKCLDDIDPTLVPVFLGVTGNTLEEHALVVEVPALSVTALSTEGARAAYLAALGQVADEREMTVGAVKKVAAALVKRWAAAGIEMAQAAKLAADE